MANKIPPGPSGPLLPEDESKTPPPAKQKTKVQQMAEEAEKLRQAGGKAAPIMGAPRPQGVTPKIRTSRRADIPPSAVPESQSPKPEAIAAKPPPGAPSTTTAAFKRPPLPPTSRPRGKTASSGGPSAPAGAIQGRAHLPPPPTKGQEGVRPPPVAPRPQSQAKQSPRQEIEGSVNAEDLTLPTFGEGEAGPVRKRSTGEAEIDIDNIADTLSFLSAKERAAELRALKAAEKGRAILEKQRAEEAKTGEPEKAPISAEDRKKVRQGMGRQAKLAGDQVQPAPEVRRTSNPLPVLTQENVGKLLTTIVENRMTEAPESMNDLKELMTRVPASEANQYIKQLREAIKQLDKAPPLFKRLFGAPPSESETASANTEKFLTDQKRADLNGMIAGIEHKVSLAKRAQAKDR